MTDEKQEGKKTIVSFIVGLLIGGLLVWAFSGPTADAPKKDKEDDKDKTEQVEEMDEENDMDNEEPVTNMDTDAMTVASLPIGDGSVTVANQAASNVVALSGVTYPISEGWIGVRDYQSEQLGSLLGVVRFSESQGLVPDEIVLQRSTEAGRQYAIVMYTENGDLEFSLVDDVQIDSVFATFTAN